ncbi:MAG: sigma-54 dependent transcriptional regulator, partial [Nitrospirales bacterium]|nr:sigma-54 dependent transcriptional regulator [Nitrospirales bacterium]
MEEGNYRILIIDDDENIREMMKWVLTSFGEVGEARTGKEAREKFQANEYDIVLLDYLLPDTDGVTLLKEFKDLQPQTEFILITMVREINIAVKAIKAGAFDYIHKDFEVEDLKALIIRVIEKLKRNQEILYLRSEVERLTEQEFILGNSPKMHGFQEILGRAASTPATVLIQGESGTGKELVARYLHNHSQRVDKPFVAVNMASIPENLVESTLFGHEKGSFTGAIRKAFGKFELADGGTLFCDEIADLKLELQSKLLRVIQESEFERVGGNKSIHVDVRIITATNRDLKDMVQEGTFREDLFYRLNVIPIYLPPLRERIEDIPLFMNLFLRRYNRKYGRNISMGS